MTRQPKNEAFARTSFLHGANAAYIEEMQALYERNPGSVSDEWRHFFASLQEERLGGNGHDEPSWARPLEQVESAGDRELLGALTGDWGEAEQHIKNQLQARASIAGYEMSPAASLRASPVTVCPAPMSSRTTACPMKPVAPVTNTFMGSLSFVEERYASPASLEKAGTIYGYDH